MAGEGGGEAGGRGFHTPAQVVAIETLDRPVVVLAGAGTGKTTLLAAKFGAVAAARGEGAVAAITFTRRAARELREGVDGERIAGGLPPLGRDALVGTFHQMASVVIKRAVAAGLASAARVADEREQAHYAGLALAEGAEGAEGEAGGAARRGKPRWGGDGPRALLRTLEAIKRTGNVPVPAGYRDADDVERSQVAGLPAPGSAGHAGALRLVELMAAGGRRDYGDLILEATRLLGRHRERLVGDIVAVLVDEYQDADAAQGAFVEALAAGRHLTCAGDDDQSIYGWRGARVENLLGFARRHPDALVVTLDVNHRCPPDLLARASELIAHNQSTTRGAKAATSSQAAPASASVVLHDLHAEHGSTRRSPLDRLRRTDLPNYVAAVVGRLLAEGTRADDVLCLVRSNADVEALVEALATLGMGSRVANASALASPEAGRMTAWLRLMVDPMEVAAAATVTHSRPGDPDFAALVAEARRDGVAVMAKLAERSRGASTDDRMARAGRRYAELRAMEGATPLDLVESVCRVESEGMGSAGGIAAEAREGRFWAVYNALVGALGGAESIEEAIESMQTRLSDDDLVEPGAELVEVATVHSVKGRQKRVVVLCAWIDGVMPSQVTCESGDLAEERRLAYVAMTRARTRLHVVVAGERPGTFATEAGLTTTKRYET